MLGDLRGTVLFMCEDKMSPHLFLIPEGLEASLGPSVKMDPCENASGTDF